VEFISPRPYTTVDLSFWSFFMYCWCIKIRVNEHRHASTLGTRTGLASCLLLDLNTLIGLLLLHSMHQSWSYARVSCPHQPVYYASEVLPTLKHAIHSLRSSSMHSWSRRESFVTTSCPQDHGAFVVPFRRDHPQPLCQRPHRQVVHGAWRVWHRVLPSAGNQVTDCHNWFPERNQMHLICVPGSSFTHMIDKMSVIS
jgi:hypothetical protein